MTEDKERRRHPRLERKEKLFIQIVTSSQDPTLPGKTTYCSTADVSATGVRLNIDHPIPEGCRLDLWISISGRPGKFFLAGAVKWSRQVEAGEHYQVGVEFSKEPKADLEDWEALFE